MARDQLTFDSELWKPVAGYEGLYEVSDLGRVRSLPRTTRTGIRGGTLLSLRGTDKDGYAQVGLCRAGKVWIRKVHTLVLEAFVGARPTEMVACHCDGNCKNNMLSNLRWDTPKANSRDAVGHGTIRRGEAVPSAVVTEADVREIRALHAAGTHTQRQIATLYGIGFRGVNSIVLRRTWRHVS